MWSLLVVVIVVGPLGGLLFARKSNRAVEGAQRLASEVEPAAVRGELSAKIRLLDARGLRRRWREVVIRLHRSTYREHA